MPIEFECPQCGKTLRTPDGSAGKQAKCPACGGITQVPGAAAPPPEENEFGGGLPSSFSPGNAPPEPRFASNPFADAAASKPAGGVAGDFSNPYAAPSLGAYAGAAVPPTEGDRTGPPWERSGKSWSTFWETFKMVLGDCERCFRTMRRTGGFGAPYLFAVSGSYIGTGFQLLWSVLLGGMVVALQNNGRGDALLTLGTRTGLQLVLLPVGVAVVLFLGAAVTHVFLMLLGGDQAGYEATFRVLAYVYGAAGVLQAIPCVGGLVVLVALIVCAIIGLSKMHNISGGKAAAAVLLPVGLCCGFSVLGSAALIWAIEPNLH